METSKKTSLTKNSYKNPSPLKTNAHQAKGKGFGSIGKYMSSSESSHAPKNKMSLGMSTTLHGKAIGGHPKHRASEFDGKGRGYMTDCK